ncbi:hypothetical protein ACIP66_02945 [Pseudomonas sp. NPDC088429]|jgi:hypothetical protein|uniref:hypothetical protein n=1 Tax=Pseudomonas sp. NPDC088429 TaxID=3364455 RepID=UPI0037F3166B
MNTADNTTGNQGSQQDPPASEQDYEHLKENVSDVLGGAREQADAQFGQYRDTAADQIGAFAEGAKSFVSELEDKDALGVSHYLTDVAESMAGLAENLRGKSAEQLLHDGAELARSNPALFIAGSIALGFGLSRFLKAGVSTAITPTSISGADTPAARSELAFGANRPNETSISPTASASPGLATGSTPSSSIQSSNPASDVLAPSSDSSSQKGEM